MSLSTGRRDLRRSNIVGSIAAATVISSTLLGAMSSGGAGASAASDKAQAKHYLLTLSDMPAGWKTEKGSSGSGSGNGWGLAVSECTAVTN